MKKYIYIHELRTRGNFIKITGTCTYCFHTCICFTFIEIRQGMINVSPIGRSCSQEERNAFFEYDKIDHVRKKMKHHFEQTLKDFDLNISIGGQISMDIFPKGWDKTYCLQFIESRYDKIYFFGDKTDRGGNDFEIFNDSRTIGHHVESPEDTIQQVQTILDKL